MAKKKKLLFEDAAVEWIASLRPHLKEQSIVKYQNLLTSYLYPCFLGRSIEKIKQQDIYMLCNQLLSTGGEKGEGLSSGTVGSTLSVLRRILEYSSAHKGCEVISMEKRLIRQTQSPLRILSVSESQKLSSYLFCNLNPANLGILLCLYTGIRIGEVCALKWEDFSFEEQSMYVHRTMQRIQIKDKNTSQKTRVIISKPKSECSVRKIPLPDEIFRLIVTYRSSPRTYFLTGHSEKFMEPRTLQNHFKSAIKFCKIQNVNFHVLRHTFATRCVELGFDLKSLSEILGHASINITLNRYVHPSMELKQKNMNILSEFLQSQLDAQVNEKGKQLS